jgi:hypothetical protein
MKKHSKPSRIKKRKLKQVLSYQSKIVLKRILSAGELVKWFDSYSLFRN